MSFNNPFKPIRLLDTAGVLYQVDLQRSAVTACSWPFSTFGKRQIRIGCCRQWVLLGDVPWEIMCPLASMPSRLHNHGALKGIP